jgi:hypothetical protein
VEGPLGLPVSPRAVPHLQATTIRLFHEGLVPATRRFMLSYTAGIVPDDPPMNEIVSSLNIGIYKIDRCRHDGRPDRIYKLR